MFTFLLLNFQLSKLTQKLFTKENVSSYIFSDLEKFQSLVSQVVYRTGGAHITLLIF